MVGFAGATQDEMEEQDAVFLVDGSSFVPTKYAAGPWAADRSHGGPVFALLTRAVEQASGDPGLVGTRLTFDLYRAVPLEPLTLSSQVLRQSGRLCLVQAELRAGAEEYARVTALLLRPEAEDPEAAMIARGLPPKPSGPDGLLTETLLRNGPPPAQGVRPGFHTRIETRWAPREAGQPLAIWFRLPIPLVAGETATALQLTAALADFGNAVANFSQRERAGRPTPFINVDSTLYLSRPARGEWIGLQEQSVAAARGTSVTSITLFDAGGAFGSAQQARLAQRVR